MRPCVSSITLIHILTLLILCIITSVLRQKPYLLHHHTSNHNILPVYVRAKMGMLKFNVFKTFETTAAYAELIVMKLVEGEMYFEL